MIIDIAPGQSVDVPADADFLITCETSFGALELADPSTELTLPCKKADGSQTQVTGTASGTSIVFMIAAGFFSIGQWAINPRALVGGHPRRWQHPAILNVSDPLSPEVNCGC